MPSLTEESKLWEAERAELQSILQSPLFARSPTLTHLLSYLCEKTFAGETDQIKEYSVALDVFDRRDSFDQDTDSIVRVQANRLRKRLNEYYAAEGASHELRIIIPVGQYVPVFQKATANGLESSTFKPVENGNHGEIPKPALRRLAGLWYFAAIVVLVAGLVFAVFHARRNSEPAPIPASSASSYSQPTPEPTVGLPIGEEVHILAGSTRKYVDHAGKVWLPDSYFSGGTSVCSAVPQIWRTLDPIIYRCSRQGDFSYSIPIKPGTYELHLHFAETFYGPEGAGGGGEGSRMITVAANGTPLLQDFDVLTDSGGDRTAEVKVFPNIFPDSDGQLHLRFSSANGGSAMLSAIEIVPGLRAHLRPVRIIARDVPYYSNDSRWWSPDMYFQGGRLSESQQPAGGTDDPEFYETERWGHFSYAIPVAPGRYTITLYFMEHRAADGRDRDAANSPNDSDDRVFNVFCNGKAILSNLNIRELAGENRPLVRKIKGLEPNAQGKLLLEFVPVKRYAMVTAIEVVQE